MGKIEESIYNIITCLILSIINHLYIIPLISWSDIISIKELSVSVRSHTLRSIDKNN
jgi:hypothetical protein